MSDDIIHGASGAKYREFKVAKPIGYWTMFDGMMKVPCDIKPSLLKRMAHKIFFGYTWHDGLDGL
jgi:hypothetical protein